MGFKVEVGFRGLGFRVQGLGFGVEGLGFAVEFLAVEVVAYGFGVAVTGFSQDLRLRRLRCLFQRSRPFDRLALGGVGLSKQFGVLGVGFGAQGCLCFNRVQA